MSPSHHNPGNERDLYLEILKKAQKESDQALIRMVAQKMKETFRQPGRSSDGCQIFSFPPPLASGVHAEYDHRDWKNRRLWRNSFLIMATFGFATGWFVFFCLHYLPFSYY